MEQIDILENAFASISLVSNETNEQTEQPTIVEPTNEVPNNVCNLVKDENKESSTILKENDTLLQKMEPIENVDITNDDARINELYENSPYKKWIKLIPKNKTVPFSEYIRKDYFIHVADILIDDETFHAGQKMGNKKRNTVIKFKNIINENEYSKKAEWLYLIVINGNIVKIGGTRTGLKGRTASYLCGHHIAERGKSGDCSKTNAYIYNTLDFYLKAGCQINMYAYQLPKMEFAITIFDKSVNVIAQTYHAFETTFIEDFNKKYGNYPFLCDNCDPDYKHDCDDASI